MLDAGKKGLEKHEGKGDEANVRLILKKKGCGHGAVLKTLREKNANLADKNRFLKKQLRFRQICKNCIEFRRERDFLFRKCKNYERHLEQFKNHSKTMGNDSTSHPDTADLTRKLEEVAKEMARLAAMVARFTQSDSAEIQRKEKEFAIRDARSLVVEDEREVVAVPKVEIKDFFEAVSVKLDEDPDMPFYDYVDARYKSDYEDEKDKTVAAEKTGTEAIRDADVGNSQINLPHDWLLETVESGKSNEQRTEHGNKSAKQICKWIGDGGAKCGREFAVIKQLMLHIKAKHILKLTHGDLVCAWDGCQRGAPFHFKKKLVTHIRSHMSIKPFTCLFENCPKAYWKKSDLKEHEGTHAAGNNQNLTLHACAFDGRGARFTNVNALEDHTESHVGDFTKGFRKRRVRLVDEISDASGSPKKDTEEPNGIDEDREAGCEVQKTTKRKHAGVRERRGEPDVKLCRVRVTTLYHTCQWTQREADKPPQPCGEILPSWHELVAHLETVHIGVDAVDLYRSCRWQGCGNKGRTLWTRSALVSHLRDHMHPVVLTQLSRCEHENCARAFDGEDSLARHQETHDYSYSLRSRVPGRFPCSETVKRQCWVLKQGQAWVLCTGKAAARKVFCPFPGCRQHFASTEEMEAHVRGHRTMAMREKPFPCEFPLCGRRFANRMALNEHVVSHIEIQSVGQVSVEAGRSVNTNL